MKLKYFTLIYTKQTRYQFVFVPCFLLCSLAQAIINPFSIFHSRESPNAFADTSLDNSFNKLIKNNVEYVDKTLLIKELLKHKDKVILITRPRKWGKTINLEMIKSFVEAQFDPKTGSFVPPKNTTNYKLFKSGELLQHDGTLVKLKYPLLIGKHQEFIDQHLAQYSVIHVSFKTWDGSSLEEITQNLRQVVARIFESHNYLEEVLRKVISNEFSTVKQKNKASADLELFTKTMTMKDGLPDIKKGIAFLSKILHEYLGKSVIVLIDDYEYPLIEAILQDEASFNYEEKRRFVKFYHAFLRESFNHNHNINKVILTGVLRLVEESRIYDPFGSIPKTPKHGGIDDRFHKFYGFTEKEVNLIFRYKGEKLREQIHDRYKGYESSKPGKQPVYNPYSVMEALHHEEVDNYWMRTDSINKEKTKIPLMGLNASAIFNILPLRSDFDSLRLSGEACINESDLHFHADDYLEFVNLLHQIPTEIEGEKSLKRLTNLAISYLLAQGYLTYSHKTRSKIIEFLQLKNSSSNMHLVWFRIPNQEVSQESRIQAELYSFYDALCKWDPQMKHEQKWHEDTLLHLDNYLVNQFYWYDKIKTMPKFFDGMMNKYSIHNAADIVFHAITLGKNFENYFRSSFSHHPSLVAFSKEHTMVVKLSIGNCREYDGASRALKFVEKYKNILLRSHVSDEVTFAGCYLAANTSQISSYRLKNKWVDPYEEQK